MSNNWFRFRKFLIRQDKTAMKVGTDGVLLGAWAGVEDCRSILDIGTGTGLVALMLAQRSGASIDAIEIDPAAALQAEENVSGSPWPGRVKVIPSSLQDFMLKAATKYDLVVCNPPFFKNSLKAGNLSRTIARHTDELDYHDLLTASRFLLNENGHLCLILPFDQEEEFIMLAKRNNLHPSKITYVKPDPGKNAKRVLLDFSSAETEVMINEICIETGRRHEYSSEYVELTKEFYFFGDDGVKG